MTNPLAMALVRGKINTPEFWLFARKYATAPAGAARHAAEEAMLEHLSEAITPTSSASADLGALAAGATNLAAWLEQNGFHANASEVRALVDLIPLRVTAREAELLEALGRLCTHESRTRAQIDADWDHARAVFTRAAPASAQVASSEPASSMPTREPFDFDEWFNEHSEGAQLRIGKDLRDFERAIHEWASRPATRARPQDESAQERISDQEAAVLWRYTRQDGYFSAGHPAGGSHDVSVGIQEEGASVNDSIQGRGPTLQAAVKDAVARSGFGVAWTGASVALPDDESAFSEDAALWRYTQQEGYFTVGRPTGGHLDVAVGVQERGASVNESIQGYGGTLREAIQNAIAGAQPRAASRIHPQRRP